MPGIVGFAPACDWNEKSARRVLTDMRKAMAHRSAYRKDALVCTPRFCATRIHTGGPQAGAQPLTEAGLSVWLDGEFYNREEVAAQLGIRADTDAALLLALIKEPDSSAALSDIDGIYSAVVHDEVGNRVHLLSDRYGLRPIFWVHHRGTLAWASEVKAFLSLPGFEPALHPRALEEFLCIGYFLSAPAWLKGVERLPPATHVTYNLEDRLLRGGRYWWWDRIPTESGGHDPREMAEELGKRFVRAVERRCGGDERVGLILSGGLDSRAILAAMPDRGRPIHALTFGQEGSPDTRIAGQAAQAKGARHHTVDLNPESWLSPRIEGVWWADGMLDLLHMHGIEHLNRMAEHFDISLNGAGGDGVVGGGHLFEPDAFPDYIRTVFGLTPDAHPDIFEALQREFSGAGSAHAFYIQHRMRCFTLHGPRLGTFGGLEYRLPFLDNRFQELLYALPLALKLHNRLYRQMLLATFPSYYKNIPWQTTGVPIAWPEWAVKARRAVRKAKNRFLSRSRDTGGYTDYPAWIRRNPARQFFEDLFLNPRALYPNHIPRNRVVQAWEAHLGGADRAQELCRYLTLELHLQQVFEGRWRNAPELPASKT